jgi:hypothetical protein
MLKTLMSSTPLPTHTYDRLPAGRRTAFRDRADRDATAFFVPVFFFAFAFGACQLRGMGCSMLTRLPSGSTNET